VVLSVFEVLTGFRKDQAESLAAGLVVQKVDGQVDAGVYALRPETLRPLKGSGQRLAQLPPAPGGAPLLLLIHGTFVDTYSTFGKLWAEHPQQVAALFAHYGGRVYALDHPTLGVSPIANALTLVQALPAGARLHLATHSRGGLVAEVLARVAGQGAVDAADLAFFPGAEHALQRQELQAMAVAVRSKGITVERVLRVACPARGTLLASKRLDAYLSVLKWAIELTGMPMVPAVLDFLAEVARRRARPEELPGLASMIPDTPLLNWLNGSEQPIPGELRVVAGDLQGDSIGSWIKTLLSDAFYWTDNDLVVHTRSMYGGSARGGGASFLLDQGGKVSHFNYFANARSAQALVDGLTQPQPNGFRPIGPLSWAGQDADGQRAAKAARAPAAAPAPERPAVFVLPGILGSNLQVQGQRIWLSLRLVGGLARLRYTGHADAVLPDGPVGLVYDDLLAHLGRSHAVTCFAFDWRKPIEDEARRLALAVAQALDARGASGQPVRLLAYSMGGLVARAMQLVAPQTWDRMMAVPGARLVMLGTPNGGAWAPMQVLSGDDTFGNALASFGSPLRDRDARQMMAEMPGLLQLQAGLDDPALNLASSQTWHDMANRDLQQVQAVNWWHHAAGEASAAAYAWGVPPQAVLDQALALRLRLDAQVRNDLPAWADKLLLVVGNARFTPDGCVWDNDGFSYLNAVDGGDGRVPLGSALLPGVRTWALDCEHGSLPDAGRAFDAYVDLLQQGHTERLALLPAPATRGAGAQAATATQVQVRSRPSRSPSSALPAGSPRSIFDSGSMAVERLPPAAPGAALGVTVVNGNLSFVDTPLMVGHYRSLALTGTEAVVNRLVGGTLSAALQAGQYPDACATHQVFINTWRDPLNPWAPPRPRCVIVVGLGEEGHLHTSGVVASVRQGVIAWAQRVAEDPQQASADIALTATLLGSGGVGISASGTARAIAQGVREANDRLAASGWPLVSQLHLVELYLDRATEAWHGLQLLAAAAPGRFAIAPTIASGVGPLRRQVDSGYRGVDYDFITATSPADDTIAFTLDTRRARSEVRAQSTQGRLLRELVARASNESRQDGRLGHTLFQLLVPPEVEPFLAGTGRVLLELDAATASIPWELLDTRAEGQAASDPRPWAIRTQLLRKLRTAQYRQQVQDACPDDAALVIGEPLCDSAVYPALPGARGEALAVTEALLARGGLGEQRINALVHHNDAASIINALFERAYRIVHIAGHGEPVQHSADGRPLSKGGVVLSDGIFLGADEIACMRTVPELVFVNCCHLAARDTSLALRSVNRAEFAWGMADALIAIGVRCVIAAGWAVDDAPAAEFATTFYREILQGRPFISAAATAREAAWLDDKSSNTWAAYQCYGDPNWTFRRSASSVASSTPGQDYEGVASALALSMALEELAVRSRWMGVAPEPQLERIRYLEARFAALWGGMGAVAEAFGLAYAEAGDADQGIAWYERAVRANDASASMKAQEQLQNLRARRASLRADRAGRQALATARQEIMQALHELQALTTLQPTLERHALAGSAWKRLALIERRAGDAPAELAALRQSADRYQASEALALQARDSDYFYPALNRMGLEWLVNQGQRGWVGFDAERVDQLRRSLQARVQAAPDFFSVVAVTELDMLLALSQRRLAANAPALAAAYADVHARVQAPWLWASVADQARFVLEPMLATAEPSERDAAAQLLQRLRGYAGLDPDLALPSPAQATRNGPQVVIWHTPADATQAAAVVAALRQRQLDVWALSDAEPDGDALAQLVHALRTARLALVLLSPATAKPGARTRRAWEELQQWVWSDIRDTDGIRDAEVIRTSGPRRLAALLRKPASVPGFLSDAPRLALPARGVPSAAVLRAVMALLPDRAVVKAPT